MRSETLLSISPIIRFKWLRAGVVGSDLDANMQLKALLDVASAVSENIVGEHVGGLLPEHEVAVFWLVECSTEDISYLTHSIAR